MTRLRFQKFHWFRVNGKLLVYNKEKQFFPKIEKHLNRIPIIFCGG